MFSLAEYDLFDWFRLALGWVVTVYATVITVQSLWGWYVWLAGQDKYIGLLRRYLIVHGLRLRFGTFWGDLIVSVLLTVVFFILWHAHGVLYDVSKKLDAARQQDTAREAIATHVQQSP